MSTIVDRPIHTNSIRKGLDQFAALPDWLIAATDPDTFCAALVRAVPELTTGALVITDCDVGHVRIKRDVWTGVYELTLPQPHSDQSRTIALRGTIIPPTQPEPALANQDDNQAQLEFGAAGWSTYLPDLRVQLEPRPSDAALPSLPILTDPEQARALLEQSIRAAAPNYQDLRIESCVPKIMRYTPGSRCTILYRLTYPDGVSKDRGWPELVVAKTYKGGKGKHAYAGMRALWESPFRKHGDVTLAEPLAYLPELNVLVQGPIREEQTLQELIASAVRANTPAAIDELYDFVRRTAAGLAGLHSSEVRFGEVRSWEDELAEVRGVVDNIASAVPSVATAAEPLLAQLEALAAQHPADQIMTIHGTFRPGQALIYQGQIGFIDFDSFCQGEPALDLSLFLRRTKDIALGALDQDGSTLDDATRAQLLAQADAICEVFLSEYERHVPISRPRVALWETLDLLTLVLHSWTKVKPERLKNAMFTLEQHLHNIGIF
jgi:thiamine kinase-like enzyme